MADIGVSRHADNMNTNPSSKNASQKIAIAPESTAGADMSRPNSASAPSPNSIARLAYSIYQNQGSQPGHEVKHWLEAEAQLFGGLERETQMHAGSSLFTSEH